MACQCERENRAARHAILPALAHDGRPTHAGGNRDAPRRRCTRVPAARSRGELLGTRGVSESRNATFNQDVHEITRDTEIVAVRVRTVVAGAIFPQLKTHPPKKNGAAAGVSYVLAAKTALVAPGRRHSEGFVRGRCGNEPCGAKTAPQQRLRTHLLPKRPLWRQNGATRASPYVIPAKTCPLAPTGRQRDNSYPRPTARDAPTTPDARDRTR